MLTFLHIGDTHISVDPEIGSHELFAAAPHPNPTSRGIGRGDRPIALPNRFHIAYG